MTSEMELQPSRPPHKFTCGSHAEPKLCPTIDGVDYANGPTLLVFDLGVACERCVDYRSQLRNAGLTPVVIGPEHPAYETIAKQWDCSESHGAFIVDKAGVARWGHSFEHPFENIPAIQQIMKRHAG